MSAAVDVAQRNARGQSARSDTDLHKERSPSRMSVSRRGGGGRCEFLVTLGGEMIIAIRARRTHAGLEVYDVDYGHRARQLLEQGKLLLFADAIAAVSRRLEYDDRRDFETRFFRILENDVGGNAGVPLNLRA